MFNNFFSKLVLFVR